MAILLTISASAQTSGKPAFVYTEASELTLTGKLHTDTPNPYHRVDTVRYKGFTPTENFQVRMSSGIAVAFRTNSSAISIQTFCSKEIVQDDLAPVALSLVPAFQRIGEIVGLVSDAERLLAQIPYGIFDVILEALGGLGAGLAVAVEGFLHAADVLVEAFRYMPEGLACLAVELFLARLEKPFGLGGHPGLESLELLLQSLTVGCLQLGHSIGMALFQKVHGPVMVLGCISESLFQKADIRIEPGTLRPELRHKDGTAHKICHKGGQCHG